MGRLDKKIAFITGTGGGQGRAAALLFAREGAVIVGCDLKVDQSEETVAMVTAIGGMMHSSAPVDLGDPDAARHWIDAGVQATGGIDILYNNASAMRPGFVEELSLEDWHFTIRNELDLVFYTTQAAWPHLKARGAGSIINTASGSTRRGWNTIGMSGHMAAKAGVIAMTRQFASEGAPHKIRANSISPGIILTPAIAMFEDQVVQLASSVPLGRIGVPDDIAYCALYLASDEASYVSAADFTVDGGEIGAR